MRRPPRAVFSRVGTAGSVLLFLLVQGCAGALLLRSPAPPVVSVHSGAHLEVVCHFPCGAWGQEALERAEAGWEAVADYLEAESPSKDLTLPTIHLYGAESEYEAVEAYIAGGRFRDTRGFSSRDSRSAHLLVDASVAEAVGEVGLPAHYLRAIAHEAAHLATYDLAAGAYWPPWLAEGMAGWVERETDGIELGNPIAADPWASTHLWRAQRLLTAGELPGADEILLGAPLRLTIPDAYAVWTEFFHFMVSGPYRDEMKELVVAVADDQIPEEYAWPVVAAAAEDMFGVDRIAELDSAFRNRLEETQPQWMEVRRSLQPLGDSRDRWLQVATGGDPGGALAWRVRGLPIEEDLRIEARVQGLGKGPWEARLALGRANGDDPLLLAVDSDGWIRLFEFPSADPASPTLLTEQPPPSTDIDLVGQQSIELEFAPGELWLRWGSLSLEATFELTESEPNGVWGIGVGPRSAAIWNELPLNGEHQATSP